jgi:hypothetical protein
MWCGGSSEMIVPRVACMVAAFAMMSCAGAAGLSKDNPVYQEGYADGCATASTQGRPGQMKETRTMRRCTKKMRITARDSLRALPVAAWGRRDCKFCGVYPASRVRRPPFGRCSADFIVLRPSSPHTLRARLEGEFCQAVLRFLKRL